MARRWKIPLYVLFTLVALVTSLVLTFPYQALGRRLELEAARALPGSKLVINDIGPAFPLGLRLGDVIFDREVNGREIKVILDRVRVRPALLPLFKGKLGAVFGVDAYAGSLDGEVTGNRKGLSVTAVARGLQLDVGQTVESATGLKIAGGLSGRVELSTDARGEVTQGSLAAVLAGGKIKSGTIMGFKVPATDLGSPELSVAVKKSHAKIEKGQAKSRDLDLELTGDVTLVPNLMASFIKGHVRLKLSDAYLSRNSDIKGLLGFAGPFRKPDGALELPLDGPLSRPLQLPGFARY